MLDRLLLYGLQVPPRGFIFNCWLNLIRGVDWANVEDGPSTGQP